MFTGCRWRRVWRQYLVLPYERSIGYGFPCQTPHEDIYLCMNSIVIDPWFVKLDSILSFCCRFGLCIGSLQCILCKDPTQEAQVHKCYLTIYSNFPFEKWVQCLEFLENIVIVVACDVRYYFHGSTTLWIIVTLRLRIWDLRFGTYVFWIMYAHIRINCEASCCTPHS